MTSKRVSQHRGFGLIELLVSLVLAAILIAGAVTVYVQSRSTFRASEEAARLQETARYAMSFVETDLRMANYWGLNNRADYIVNRAGQPDTPTGTWSDDCGENWATDVDRYIEAFNASKGAFSACVTATLAPSSDFLVVRRVGETPVTGDLTENTLYLQTSRLQGTLFVADGDCSADDIACIPAGYLPPQSQSSPLLVHAYFVTANAAGIPTLRRMRLVTGPATLNEEIIPGVEDMQIEVGVDNDADTAADYFVEPDDAPVGASIIAVRVWLRVRSAEPDFQFLDTRSYQYGGVNYTPGATGNANRYRRMLVSKTIQLRNTRT